MPNICIPCASVKRLLDSGVFEGFAPQFGDTCDNGTPTGNDVARSLHNPDLTFFCAQ